MKKADAEIEARRRRTAREGRQQALAHAQRLQMATQTRSQLARAHCIANRVEAMPTRVSHE